MKIVSKYKDFYDGVQSLGLDKSTIYFRKTEIVETPTAHNIDEKLYGFLSYHRTHRIRCFMEGKDDLFTNMSIFGFCGKLYKCFTVHTTDKNSNSQIKYLYSQAEIIEYFKAKEKEYVLDDLKFYRKQSRKKKKTSQWMDYVPPLEEIKGAHNEIFQELNKPIFFFPSYVLNLDLLKERVWSVSAQNENMGIVVGPNLKDIEFHRIKGAFESYQEIEQYLNGVLGNTEDSTDKRTDIEKIKSHGFDLKYGFRKRKKK